MAKISFNGINYKGLPRNICIGETQKISHSHRKVDFLTKKTPSNVTSLDEKNQQDTVAFDKLLIYPAGFKINFTEVKKAKDNIEYESFMKDLGVKQLWVLIFRRE